MYGKWHLGTAKEKLPTDQGFDEWFGFESTDVVYWTANSGTTLKPWDYIREARKGDEPRNVQLYDMDSRRQIDRMLTDHAVDYIKKNAKSDRPFFLYDSDLYFLGASYPFSANWVLDAQISRLCVKDTDKVSTLAVAPVTYNLSKRTALYTSLGCIRNAGSAAIPLDAGGTVGVGLNQVGVMSGIRRTF